MPRPTIDHLFDHTLKIWRPIPSQDGLGGEQQAHVLVANIGAAINRPAIGAGDTGGSGLAPVGGTRMYLRPDANVKQRDIVQIVSGPHSPSGLWEIDGLPVIPRGHHTEISCIKWHGTLNPSSSS